MTTSNLNRYRVSLVKRDASEIGSHLIDLGLYYAENEMIVRTRIETFRLARASLATYKILIQEQSR